MASLQAVPPITAALASVRGTAQSSGRAPRGVLGFVLLLFLLSCIFDPDDRVMRLKVWIFMGAWGLTLLALMSSRTPATVPRGLLLYTMLFMLVPLYSITWFFLTDGNPRFEGFAMFKGYVLISLALILVLNRINLL